MSSQVMNSAMSKPISKVFDALNFFSECPVSLIYLPQKLSFYSDQDRLIAPIFDYVRLQYVMPCQLVLLFPNFYEEPLQVV